MPRKAKKYHTTERAVSGNSYLRAVFHASVILADSCYDDFVAILQKHLKKPGWVCASTLTPSEALPSDLLHYQQFTSFFNRFVWLFLTSPQHDFPALRGDDPLPPPTLATLAHSTSQEFFAACIEDCKKLLCDEMDWHDAIFPIRNICTLFDIYHFLLTQEQDAALRYKGEIVVNAVFAQLSTIQLLPDVLVQWKTKDGLPTLFALIAGIDSLLRICQNMKERGTTVLKKKRTRKTQGAEEEEVPSRMEEFREFLFNLRFIYNIIYRNAVFEKYVQWFLIITRFVLILYNYPFHPPTINRCLCNYFANLFDYVDEDDNASTDEDYNAAHAAELRATMRPRLYNALLLEALNRVLHDPLANPGPRATARRDDLEQLGRLAKRIVGVVGGGDG